MQDVHGYEGLYEITSCGKVWSYRKKGFLKPILVRGYLKVNLYKDKKAKAFYIHRFVAETYLSNPDNLSDVNHKDENKLNNSVNNLEWMSHLDNCNYGTRNERLSQIRKGGVIE